MTSILNRVKKEDETPTQTEFQCTSTYAQHTHTHTKAEANRLVDNRHEGTCKTQKKNIEFFTSSVSIIELTNHKNIIHKCIWKGEKNSILNEMGRSDYCANIELHTLRLPFGLAKRLFERRMNERKGKKIENSEGISCSYWIHSATVDDDTYYCYYCYYCGSMENCTFSAPTEWRTESACIFRYFVVQ